jgi:hypothetical protein
MAVLKVSSTVKVCSPNPKVEQMTTTDIFIIGMYLTSIVGTVVILSSVFWIIDTLARFYNRPKIKTMIAEDGTEWLVGYIDEFPGYKKLF